MFRDNKNFTNLVVILNKSDRKEIFATKFVGFLLEQFWEYYKRKLVIRMFLPFCLYAICSISFMYFSTKRIVEGEDNAYAEELYLIAAIVTSILWAYHMFLDYKQLKSSDSCWESLKKYLTDLYNINDLIHLTITIVFIVTNLPDEPLLKLEN